MPRRERRIADRVRKRLIPAIESGELAELVAAWFGAADLRLELSRPRSQLRRALADAEGIIEQRLLGLVASAMTDDPKIADEWLEQRRLRLQQMDVEARFESDTDLETDDDLENDDDLDAAL